MLEDVADEDVLALEADGLEELRERVAALADERPAEFVLGLARVSPKVHTGTHTGMHTGTHPHPPKMQTGGIRLFIRRYPMIGTLLELTAKA